MDGQILALRRDLLRRTQNRDGGWGYFAGKQSWLEPTTYALLALHGDAESREASTRAWSLLQTWQLADGGWKPAAQLAASTWVTALGVIASSLHPDGGAGMDRGTAWLLRSTGIENSLKNRVMAYLGRADTGRDTRYRGWPWRDGTVAWVEPTVHAIVALRLAATRFKSSEVKDRIAEGESLLLSMRARDGGWNYGSPAALGIDLPSYPETTALAILGLQERTPGPSRERALRCQAEGSSRMAAAWLSIALPDRAAAGVPAEAPPDLMIAALEALAAPGGNGYLLRTGANS